MYTLLIVDEDREAISSLRKAAEGDGMAVLECTSGKQALEYVKRESVDIMVLDVSIGDMDGFALCQEVCVLKNTPILIYTTYGDEFIKLFAYNQLGISDYIVKPCSMQEVVARLKVILRHRTRATTLRPVEENTFSADGLVVHYDSRTLTIDDEPVILTAKEFDLLTFFIRHQNHVLTRQHILKEVWGYDFFGSDRTVDTHVKRLRDRLGNYRNYIVTIHRVGYKFIPEHS